MQGEIWEKGKIRVNTSDDSDDKGTTALLERCTKKKVLERGRRKGSRAGKAGL